MKNKIGIACLLIVIAAAFCVCTKWLPAINDPNSPPNQHISDYYIQYSEEDTGAANIVSGTLADYRGYDTLYETTVMFVSGLVVVLLLSELKKEKDVPEKKERSEDE